MTQEIDNPKAAEAQTEIDKQIELARLQRENLELEQKNLAMRVDEQRRIADKERNEALSEFYSLSESELDKLPVADRSGITQAKPATVFWQRTVFYYKPVIQRGKLVGKKVAIFAKAGRYVRADMVKVIEEVEAKHKRLNDSERKKLEMIAQAKGITFRGKDKAWFVAESRQNTVKIEDISTVSPE